MDDPLSPIVLAFQALTAEMLEDLTDRLDAQPRAEPLNYGILADLLAARIEPRLQALEERTAEIAASIAILKIRARSRHKLP